MGRNVQQVMDQEYLVARARILELAAILDRLDRSEGSPDDDPRAALLHQGLSVLLEDEDGRAERVQLLFSRPYDGQWRKTFGV